MKRYFTIAVVLLLAGCHPTVETADQAKIRMLEIRVDHLERNFDGIDAERVSRDTLELRGAIAEYENQRREILSR